MHLTQADNAVESPRFSLYELEPDPLSPPQPVHDDHQSPHMLIGEIT